MKSVTLYRPAMLENALDDFDRYVESFFGDSSLLPSARVFTHLPAVDIRETKNTYVLEAELPGYDEESIQVHVDGGTLTIESKQADAPARDVSEKEGGKKEEKEEKIFIIRERRRSSFTRSFKLPENVDPDTISAHFKNGILSLEIKKRTESQKRMIPIAKK
ncbi:MAG: Hsp20/alpha crystallin family protein [Treponema sp.]|nr:Hsp20/alpha crystallin family protein [Treponema sp.]